MWTKILYNASFVEPFKKLKIYGYKRMAFGFENVPVMFKRFYEGLLGIIK